MKEKITALLQDKAFTEKLTSAESADDVSALFKAEGVELTPADIMTIKSRLEAKESGELSEDDLENVAGGVMDLIDDALNAFVDAGSWLYSKVSRRW